MTSAHQICVPRMRDLLSRPLARLRGHTSETLLEALDQFDLTLSENTSAIQASVNSIVRAPIHLAEKLQPVIEELISAQTSLSGPNPIGEPSRSNNCGDEDDFVDTQVIQIFAFKLVSYFSKFSIILNYFVFHISLYYKYLRMHQV